MLLANPLQRVIIGINLEKLLDVKAGQNNIPPSRLFVQGFGRTGKTFTITAITYITRRLFRRNSSVLNMAPTSAASNLIHNTIPLPSKIKRRVLNSKRDRLPTFNKKVKTLRNSIGFSEDNKHQL